MREETTGRSPAGEWFAAGLFLVYAALLFAHRGAPSLTDTANWTYQGVLLREHLLRHADTAHALKHYPIPNSTATVGIGLLALMLPWMLAVKAWLALQLGACFWAMRHLLRTLRSGWVSWVVMPQAVFLNLNFWYGFLNFELGVACVLLTASLLLRGVRGERGKPWLLGFVLLFAFFTHMIAFAFCALLLLLYAAQTGRWRVLWQAVPAAALSVWYLVGRFLFAGNADGQAGMQASVRNYSAAFWVFKGNSYLKSLGFVNPSSTDSLVLGRAGFIFLFAVNLLLAGVLLFVFAKAVRESWTSERKFLWLAILIVLPVFVLAPGTALGVSDPGARLLQVALTLAMALALDASQGRRTGQVAAGCALVLTLFGIVAFNRFGFQPRYPPERYARLPERMIEFAHVPNDDQDFFYQALDRGDVGQKVFPTGLFLNVRKEPSAGLPGDSSPVPEKR